jgi:hemerythrin-like domain-containing protein
MKDKDNQFLFESYRETVEEGRKKKYTERERKTVIDPDTGEERKESYYEMMMRIKGIRGGAGARSRATRYKKASQGKLKGVEKDIIRYVENSPEDANDIINFASEYVDKAFAKKVVEQMILNGILDEVFEGEQPEPDVDPDKLGELEGHIEYDKDDPEVEVADELEDY